MFVCTPRFHFPGCELRSYNGYQMILQGKGGGGGGEKERGGEGGNLYTYDLIKSINLTRTISGVGKMFSHQKHNKNHNNP